MVLLSSGRDFRDRNQRNPAIRIKISARTPTTRPTISLILECECEDMALNIGLMITCKYRCVKLTYDAGLLVGFEPDGELELEVVALWPASTS
jgi:hypothetical protein